MIRKAMLTALTLGAAPAFAQLPAFAQAPGDAFFVPSGQTVSLIEVLPDAMADGLSLRLRFLAPAIAEPGFSFDDAVADMEALCREFGLDLLENSYPDAVRIIVSLSDRPVEFGVQDPESTQFFEAYTPDNGDCIWEEF